MLFCRQYPKNPNALASGRPTMKSYPASLGLVCGIAPDGVQPKPLVLSRGIPLEQSMFRQHQLPIWYLHRTLSSLVSVLEPVDLSQDLRVLCTLDGLRRMYPIACSGCGPHTPFPALHP